MRFLKIASVLISFLFLYGGTVFGFSTNNTSLTRTFDKSEVAIGQSIAVTITFTNSEAASLRGFYYAEQIPQGLVVSTTSVKINGNIISNYFFESGSVGDVYPGNVVYRWILETPTAFLENNPISSGSTVQIVYSISSIQAGTFNLVEFNWVGYYQGSSKAAFGHSEVADKKSIRFFNFDDSTVMDLVTDYYNSILDRAPEPGGAEWWTDEIERVVSLGINVKEGFIAVGKAFFNSDEYLLQNKTNAAYVTDLYETFLQRLPDQTEIDYWVGYLTTGMSRQIALNYFVYSLEFRFYMEGLFGVGTTWPENNLVNDFYRGILGRLPDTDGFNAYLGLMRAAQCTGPQQVEDLSNQIALGFIQSAEYGLRARTDGQFIGDLYDAILRRGALPSEVNYWLTYLGTSTRELVLQFFTDSPEFQIRVHEVIDAGCL